VLDEKELEQLFTNLSQGLSTQLRAQSGSFGGGSGAGSGASASDAAAAAALAEAKAKHAAALLSELAQFDTGVVQSACAMGFSREQALYCLKEMQAAVRRVSPPPLSPHSNLPPPFNVELSPVSGSRLCGVC
jgi:hypothetical protein